MALSAGDRVGPYESLALIGKGGMGGLSRALHEGRPRASLQCGLSPYNRFLAPGEPRVHSMNQGSQNEIRDRSRELFGGMTIPLRRREGALSEAMNRRPTKETLS
jgi:hypothetical protein